jgi:hypothetical protein
MKRVEGAGRVAWLAGVLLALWVPAAAVHAAAEAGRVVTVAGRVAAATEDGDIRALSRGARVNSGETVVTSPHSFVRLKFIDGAYVILRPNTRFHIAAYKMADKPEENRSFFDLIKGGFRTVTGLIGKRNRRGYRVRTSVATIGIRGTDYEVRDCKGDCDRDGLFFKVHHAGEEGGITVSNAGGSRDYREGYGYVKDGNTPAVAIPEADAAPIIEGSLPRPSCD